MFPVNLRAPFFLLQDAARVMPREKIEGAIVKTVNVGLRAARGPPSLGVEDGLLGLTRNLAFARHRIRVNGLAIGYMDTPGEDAI